jgi:type VI secretion system secreted protein Hcp
MAQTDFFLKIPGLDGESEDATYKNCIDVESWSWGMTQSGSMHIAGGGGKGKVSIHDLSVTKNVDKASPALMQKCCDGEHLAEATLICRKAGGSSQVEYLKIKMEEVLVSSYSQSGGGGDTMPLDSFTLNFAKVSEEYTPQDAKGAAGGGSVLGWNARENIPM